VHDRRLEGRVLSFANQGALYQNAMVWYDRETGSLWSQPWGKAIHGPLQGAVLRQIPAEIVPWGSWKAAHPQTLAMVTSYSLAQRGLQVFDADFVIGVAIGGDAKAYPYALLAEEQVVNDWLGDFPLLILTDPESRTSRVFLRRIDEQVLEFERRGDRLVDLQTGTRWDRDRGLATEGPLAGQVLHLVPHATAYDWAWEDFYGSDRYGEGR
jgi:hypothetical protein